MEDVALTPAVQSILASLQTAQVLGMEASERLASGRRVTAIQDAPRDFAQVQALSSRVGDLATIGDGISGALRTVEAATVGIDALRGLTAQLQGVAASARGGTEAARAAAAEQFDAILAQIGPLAADAELSGVSLLSGDVLRVELGDVSGATLTLAGPDVAAGVLGISGSEAFNGFATDADIDQALVQVDSALSTLASAGRTFTSQIATLIIREDFTSALSTTLEGAAATLATSDVATDAAAFVAARVRSQLAILGLDIAQEGHGLLADLLSRDEEAA